MVLYPLSKHQKQIVGEWLLKKDKPLFISGSTGTGKSCLARELLKQYHIIEISVEHLKYKGNLIEYIKNSLFKKDILMMCSDIHYKSLIIDDFHYFIKEDKPNSSKLIDFIKTINSNHPVIVISNNIDHTLYSNIDKISYHIKCIYSPKLYKNIFKNKVVNSDNLSSNLHYLKNNLCGFNSYIDKDYSINTIIDKLLYEKNTIVDRFILCSSEYKILSLNCLENTKNILRNYKNLYKIYKSLCFYDMLETKYIDRYIDYDIYILYACIIPIYFIKKDRLIKKVSLTYNKYISRSLIQIHNQSLLSSFNYLELLDLLYGHYKIDNKENILIITNNSKYNMNTLFKQIKVYNYFYNKNITKKYVTQTLKKISS